MVAGRVNGRPGVSLLEDSNPIRVSFSDGGRGDKPKDLSTASIDSFLAVAHLHFPEIKDIERAIRSEFYVDGALIKSGLRAIALPGPPLVFRMKSLT